MPKVGKAYLVKTKYGKARAKVNWIKDGIVNCDMYFYALDTDWFGNQVDIKLFEGAEEIE